jgi:hypothetical protein
MLKYSKVCPTFIPFISSSWQSHTQSDNSQEKATYFKDYDKNKRTRSCQSEWEQGRSWLKDTDNGMVCTICQENGDPPYTI